MPLDIIRNDITKVNADAIVNTTNRTLKMGGGVCGAIFAAAGAELLQKECDAIGGCEVGQAVITKAYGLLAKYVIHTVGPIWHGGGRHEAERLADCYTNSLKLAQKHNCQSIAFPLISSGVYGYPKDGALQVAISAIGAFLLKNEMTVTLVVFDRKAFRLSEKLFSSISGFIDDHYVDKHHIPRTLRNFELYKSVEFDDSPPVCPTIGVVTMPERFKGKRSLEDVVSQLDESFSQMLLRLISEKDRLEVDVYKKANIDRKLFSKIKNQPGYNPSKSTAVAFAIALELNLDETRDLLAKAGYTLSHSHKFDLLIEYFIIENNYDIFEINEALFAFDQPLLGVCP
ncbi:macro domain-containing protein [Deltaproteobacteria bacterium OttesenSCG-928-M10]|nr:macro domain-containing protein [Deltaproteobacteria bacterium OttesenSCG-928-M10]